MITTTNISLNFGVSKLFENVNLKFLSGNCYGIIGANGSGKSTFLKILSGDIEPSTGEVSIAKHLRISTLKQDHYAFDEFTVLDTIIQGNPRLFYIIKQKDILYSKEDFTDEDGLLVSELEGEFAELNGWDAETEAAQLLQGLGLKDNILYSQMNTLGGNEKVKVLLAQALFGHPDIILLDEPTNHLDLKSVNWLEDFIMEFTGTVIVVSHDRHFLNTVCTHIVDIDYTKINLYTGNYDFWYESSMLMQQITKDQNSKKEAKIKDLQSFIARFSANKSKARQATSRRNLIEKLTLEEMPASTRRYPFVGFQIDREPGKEILTVEGVSHSINGVKILNNISFRVDKGDKIALVGENEIANTTLIKILMGEITPDEGKVSWGISTTQSYFPKDNTKYFENGDVKIINWLEAFSKDKTVTHLRSFLGRMLFSGDNVFKQVGVLSGGEKVRCMLSKMMLNNSNVLVFDQPTNHLDLESITALNNGLVDFKGIVIFTSHDHQFIQTIANRIFEIVPTGLKDKIMTFDEYISL